MGLHNFIDPRGFPGITCRKCEGPMSSRLECGDDLPPDPYRESHEFDFHLKGDQLWFTQTWIPNPGILIVEKPQIFTAEVWAFDVCGRCKSESYPTGLGNSFLLDFENGLLKSVRRADPPPYTDEEEDYFFLTIDKDWDH